MSKWIFQRCGCLIGVIWLGFGAGAQESTPEAKGDEKSGQVKWSETDTKLANHYIQLLQQKPEFGNVLNLLWDLYEKRDQTDLLVEYFKQAASAEESAPVAQLLYAHLLRKRDDLDSARDFYGKVLDEEPENAIALKASAEISDQQGRTAKAISLYGRAMEQIPMETREGVAIRLRKAALHREQDQLEEAVSLWNAILEAYPTDIDLRTEVVSFLLEAGETESAANVLRQLAEKSNDPATRLNALMELNRLYEFINDFEKADEVVRDGLKTVHFKSHQHSELFSRLVRLHERFDQLPQLRKELEAAASIDNPSEKSVLLMAEFCRLTADPAAEEKWVKRLSELVPGDSEYQVRLAMLLMDNDRYEEAAEILDQLLAANPQAPLRFTLLRSRVALNDDGRVEGEEILKNFLEEKNPGPEVRKEILDFAREFFLDGVVEQLLRDRLADTGEVLAPIELARFLQQRGRRAQAVETLESYVESAGEAKTTRAQRLHEVSRGYRDMDMQAEALAAVEEAIGLQPTQGSFYLTKAEILIERKSVDEAIEAFEEVRKLTPGLEDKAEVDQRMFSLLRGLTDEPEVPVDASGFPRLNLNRRGGRETDDPPPKKLVAYFDKVKSAAVTNPSVETHYRAGWWGFKMQDTQECFAQLNKAKAVAGQPVKEVEQLLLEMAVQMERPTLMARHLEVLAEIDPENQEEYLHRRAEVRFLLGFEDEAVRTLKDLASKPDASLNTLKTLAKAYERLGSEQRQVEVWRDAYRRSNLFEKRQIIKQLTSALIQQRQPEEALKVQIDLVQRETDPIQKRKQFDGQISLARRHFLLDWMEGQYAGLAREKPFERFYPEALAKIHRARGDDTKAFEAMKKAYYMSGQDRELLNELGALAGKTDDLKAAIYYRRQLIANSEEETSLESWKSLIQMLEADLQLPDADLIRRRLESKFGQDEDFLADLVKFYRDSGQNEAAMRVQEKLANLKPWDVRNRFELGLMKRDQGDRKGAADAFEGVLETTDGKKPMEFEREISVLPVIRGGWYEGVGSKPTDSALGAMQLMLEGFAFVNEKLQSNLIEWLERPHPEFHRVPTSSGMLRLRAIEELAHMKRHSSGDQLSEWISRWKNGQNISPTDKLWAYHHAGAAAEAIDILRTHRPQGETGKVWKNVLILQQRQPDAILAEVNSDSELLPQIVAIFLTISVLPESEIYPPENDPLFRDLALSEPIARLIFEKLVEKKDWESAYRIGKIFVQDRSLAANADFHYSLSRVAGTLGREEDRGDWLRRALELYHLSIRGQLPRFYAATISELDRWLESDAERREFHQEIREWIEGSPVGSSIVKQEVAVLLRLLENRTDDALKELAELNHLTTRQTRIGTDDPDEAVNAERERWIRLQNNLSYFGDRFSCDAIVGRKLYEYTAPEVSVSPVSQIGLEEMEEYETQRLVRFLESIPPAERQVPIQIFADQLSDINSRMNFALTLDQFGFRRESMFLYKRYAEENPDDYSLLRRFFDAAIAAKEPQPALEVVERFLSNKLVLPAGMGIEDLKRFHAEFLFQSRDVERQSQLAQLEEDTPNKPTLRVPAAFSGATAARESYRAALVRTYEKTGDEESLFRLLRHLRSRNIATRSQLLKGALWLQEQGKLAEALQWAEEIETDQTHTQTELAALRLRLELIHEIGSEPDLGSQLTDLMRVAFDYRDPDLIISIATRLTESGNGDQARSALRIRARSSSHRQKLLSAVVRLSNNLQFEETEPVLRQLLDSLTPEAGSVLEFATLARESGDRQWLPVLEPYLTRDKTRVGAGLA
ncbi:MAG: hypothetical protein HKN23_09455, partial [Verrucomicrobiales bacterium]|nr:hypothetical protein [Verrucomicrobiales bacterium]